MEKIIPLKAKFIMDENEDDVVLDVRNLDEYVMDGHISGATLICGRERPRSSRTRMCPYLCTARAGAGA